MLIPRTYLRKAVFKECAKKWVAVTAGTLLCCIYFSNLYITGVRCRTFAAGKHAERNRRRDRHDILLLPYEVFD